MLESRELLELMLPLLRADFQIGETYIYEPAQPLRCPIVALGGTDDPEVSDAALHAWRTQTTGRFQSHLVEGGHFFLETAGDRVRAIVCSALSP